MRPAIRPVPSNPVPLCVDLDGTLVKTDTFMELALKCAISHPWTLWQWPGWLLKGKAHLKRKIAELVSLDPTYLPFNPAVLAYVEAQWRTGRVVALATGADILVAQKVAEHLGYFDHVIASDGVVNRVGRSKLHAIQECFGNRRFAYIGNGKVDETVWKGATAAILVNVSQRKSAALTKRIPFSTVLGTPERPWRGLLKALRMHQWAKNLLIFVPIVLARQMSDPVRLAHVVLAFCAFSLLASSMYLLNDLLDLDADRRHEEKRTRPFACGAVSVLTGITAIPVLAGIAMLMGLLISPTVFLLLLGYMALTIGYSVYLKRRLVLDVLALSACYGLRVILGGAAATVEVSNWLLAFTGFLFFSLAFLKRFVEIRSSSGIHVGTARGYSVDDGPALGIMGAASGYLATLVLALYVSSERVVALYSAPQLLWLVCPLMLYWVSRVWLLAYRGQVHGDPVLFAVRDRSSYVIGALTLSLLLAAAWLKPGV